MLIVTDNDPTGPAALAARKWLAENGPSGLKPLPLGYNEREALKHGGVDHILAWFARSLDCRNYDVLEHPAFDEYARGVMASEFCPYFIKDDETLQKRFPLPTVGMAEQRHGLGAARITGAHEEKLPAQ